MTDKGYHRVRWSSDQELRDAQLHTEKKPRDGATGKPSVPSSRRCTRSAMSAGRVRQELIATTR